MNIFFILQPKQKEDLPTTSSNDKRNGKKLDTRKSFQLAIKYSSVDSLFIFFRFPLNILLCLHSPAFKQNDLNFFVFFQELNWRSA